MGQTVLARYQTYDSAAFPARAKNASPESDRIAPPLRWATKVMIADAADIANSGTFSCQRVGRIARFKGQTSMSISVSGRVTSIGLAINPNAKSARTSA